MKKITNFWKSIFKRHLYTEKQVRNPALGMSLIEIMTVLAIIAFVTAGVGVLATKAINRSKVTETQRTMESVQAEFTSTSRGKCITADTIDQLAKDGLFKSNKILDGWGRPFKVICPGGEGRDLDLISYGKDGKEGGGDDIYSWER